MALPVSPPISASMIRAQYGGGATIAISNYYRGGPLVPNNGSNAGVPTGGPLAFSNFLGQGGGSGGGLAATNSGATGTQFRNEPAPSSLTVSASGNVFVTGGSGSYTCTWAHLSGSTGVPTPSANNFSPSFSASVAKNTALAAVKRCTVSDGVNAPVTTDMNVRLEYNTDL